MQIDPASPDWPREQAAAWLRERISSGELGPQLPSQMELAELLGISPKTVQKVLDILKAEGLVYGRPGRGTFVRKPAS